MIHISCINFYAILLTRKQDQHTPKISEKWKYSSTREIKKWKYSSTTASKRFLSKVDKHQFYVWITPNVKFHQILCLSSLETLATKFLLRTHRQTQTHIQTNKHFPEIVVFLTPQNVSIRQKPEIENLHETNTFFYLCRRK